MDEYYDLYYPDGRNARRVVRPAPASRPVFVPPPAPAMPMSPAPAPAPVATSPFVQPPPMPSPYGGPPPTAYGMPYGGSAYGMPYLPPPYAAPAYGMPYGAPSPYGMPVYGAPPYGMPYGAPFAPAPSGLQSLLGNVSLGTLVEMGTAGFAALQDLPPPPVATDDVATNVQNLITYQNALAQHAKRDERVRTFGSLVGKLVG